MSTLTENYNLIKPASSDNVNIEDINNNMDAIDEALNNKSENTHGHQLADSNITGILPVSKGGTGASDAIGAKANLGIVQSDYAVNDNEDPAYIKNRTHYTSKTRQTISQQQTSMFTGTSGTGYWASAINYFYNYFFTEDEYIVIWDGTEYVCENKGYFGNKYLYGSSYENTGEPFYIPFTYSGTSTQIYSSESGNHTFCIVRDEETIIKLNEKYLPTVPITKGGTGATSASSALSNLGAASTSHTHALTSSSLTGTLPIEKGGTGATTQSAALTALGIKAGGVGVTIPADQDRASIEVTFDTPYEDSGYAVMILPSTSVAGGTYGRTATFGDKTATGFMAYIGVNNKLGSSQSSGFTWATIPYVNQ